MSETTQAKIYDITWDTYAKICILSPKILKQMKLTQHKPLNSVLRSYKKTKVQTDISNSDGTFPPPPPPVKCQYVFVP